MKWTTLDFCARSVLNRQQKSIHYYLEFLKHTTDCFRELGYDTLQVINTTILTLDEFKKATLPSDYCDFVKIGVANGQFVQPFLYRNGYNRLTNYENGEAISYGNIEGSDFTTADSSNFIFAGYPYNDFTGGLFGLNSGGEIDTFKIIKERGLGEIQFHEGLSETEIILEYISDGSYTDAATMVDPRAQATIEAYVIWMSDRAQAADKDSPKARNFGAEWRKLRARLNSMTIEDVRRSLRRGYMAAPKN